MHKNTNFILINIVHEVLTKTIKDLIIIIITKHYPPPYQKKKN